MESDTSENKKIPLEEMSKEEVIKKYNNMLMLAKKAKQSKDGKSSSGQALYIAGMLGTSIIKLEQVFPILPPLSLQLAIKESLEELKRTKDRESKLISEVNALKKVIESYTAKEEEFRESEHRVKQNEEKNENLRNSFQKLQDQYAMKIAECTKLEETLRKMSEKLALLEEKHSITLEKMEDFKENYAKIDIEKKLCEEKLLAYEKEDSKGKYEEITGKYKALLEDLKRKEKEVNELTRACEQLEEKLKNVPENWTEVINENKKLKKFLSNAEESKSKLTDELNYFRKSIAEFDEKSKEYAKLSEKLIKEERENLKLMEEINEWKRASSERDEENGRKLKALQEEKESLEEALNEELKFLETQLKRESEEKEKLLNTLREQEETKFYCRGEDAKNKELQTELEEIMKREQNLKSEKELLNKRIEKLQMECEDKLEIEKKENSALKTEREELKKRLQEKVFEATSKSQEWEEQFKAKEEELLRLNRDLDRAREALKKSREKGNDCGGIGGVLEAEEEASKREIEKVKADHEKFLGLIRLKLEEVWSSFVAFQRLKNDFTNELKEKLKGFQGEQNEVRKRIEEVLFKYVSQLHNGNSELLSEMNIMNQALKERGETISKLEQLTETQRKELEETATKIANQSMKLQEKNKKIDEMEEEITVAKQEVESKHKAMREMEEEMWRVKNNEPQGEALSSSTLSRAEESARLMELEESFEERYSKLKVIAVKLKKKVAELQKQVEAERSRLITAEAEYQNKVAGFHNQVKSLRNIQTEYDALQDVLDEERREKNASKKALELAQQEISSLKLDIENIKSDREKYKNDKTSFEKIKKEFAAHIAELKQTVEKQKAECGQLEKQIDEMKSQLAAKDRHLEEERERHRTTTQLLEEQRQDSKKHSVLELEMAAYEKTAEELKKKLDNKEKNVKELENLLESQKKLVESKEEEINNLKSNLLDAELKSDGISCQVRQLNEELSGQRSELEKKAEIVKALEKSSEENSSRVESLSLELEEVTRLKFQAEEKFRSAEEKLFRQIHGLEDRISTLQGVLNQREVELEELKKEYNAYKVRAQSVLRQSQKEANPSKQQTVLEELEQVKITSESLKARLGESSKKLQKLAEENETLLQEKRRLFGRVQDLNAAVTELRDENQALKEAKQKESEQHAETLRMQRLHSDTLAQCFQKQIADLEAKHATQLEELKREQERTQAQEQKCNQIFLTSEIRRGEGKDVPERRKISNSFVPVKPEKEVLDVMLLEREECEGSESVGSTSPQTGSGHLVPLEQLLNDPDQPDRPRKFSHDVAQLRNSLEKSENRTRHLTILLAEAESDSARLNQLNEVLKEEIRRLQRSLEREKHAQNFEYLKNVILKFVSLQSVDERLRLVPVLNTILKLSPEEEHALTNCAKGVSEGGSRGWGNYLGIWPGG